MNNIVYNIQQIFNYKTVIYVLWTVLDVIRTWNTTQIGSIGV